MAARITIEGVALLADPTGALFWPERRLLVVADLHFEKGSSFARHGRFLPPYDTRATLDRLARVLRLYRPERVVALGDSFHDRDAPARLDGADAERLERMVRTCDWTWVAGNHDPSAPARLGGVAAASLAWDGLVLRHEPEPGGGLAPGEVCGHFHPKAGISLHGRRVAGPCFVTDGRRLILPAFGAYAGGLDVLDPVIARLFGRAGFRVLMLGRERLHLFPHHRLTPFRVIQDREADVTSL